MSSKIHLRNGATIKFLHGLDADFFSIDEIDDDTVSIKSPFGGSEQIVTVVVAKDRLTNRIKKIMARPKIVLPPRHQIGQSKGKGRVRRDWEF